MNFTAAPISLSHNEEKTILSVFDVSPLLMKNQDLNQTIVSSPLPPIQQVPPAHYDYSSDQVHDFESIQALASSSSDFDPVLALMQLSRDVRMPSSVSGSDINQPQVGDDELPSHIVGSPARQVRKHAVYARKRSSSVAFFESQSDSGSEDKKRKFKCTIDGCDKGFPSRAHLERHQRGVHYKYKPFKCPHPACGKSFSRHDNMLQHYRSHKK